MSNNKSFPFDVDAWIGGTIGLSRIQRSCYLDLLILQFKTTKFTEDQVKETLGNDYKIWDSLKIKFKTEAGLFWNKRLEFELNKKAKIKEESPKSPLFQECIGIYCEWIKHLTEAPAKIGGGDGKALKYIIAYLRSVCNDETKITQGFRAILVNHRKWDKYHQGQIKLMQINSNLINIINSIKNGKKSSAGISGALADHIREKYDSKAV